MLGVGLAAGPGVGVGGLEQRSFGVVGVGAGVVVGFGQISSTLFSVSCILLLESYSVPSGRKIVTPHLA